LNRQIIIGSRGSALARWQAAYTYSELKKLGYDVTIKYITTKGDITHHLTFDKIEGKGFFTKEIEDELLDGSIDIAVHSHKDLPTDNPKGLVIAACSYRENPTDCLLINANAYNPYEAFNLKKGAVVGTSSSRRKSQLLALRPDLDMRDIRGNVPTRVEKLNHGYDAVVLATAGLNRLQLDLSAYHVRTIPVFDCIPAPAQGVLAYQIRENDAFMQQVAQQLNQLEVAQDIATERGILNKLGGGCQQPIGVYCETDPSGEQMVWAAYAQSWDDFPQRVYMKGKNSQQLINNISTLLKNRGQKSVFISRELDQHSFFKRAMQHYGYTLHAQSLLSFSPVAFDPNSMATAHWLFFSSPKAVAFFLEQMPADLPIPRLAAIGQATADAMKPYKRIAEFVGIGGDMQTIALQFAEIAYGQNVIFPQATNSLQTVQVALQEMVNAQTLIVYQNNPVQTLNIPICDILVFTSPANAKNYYQHYQALPQQKVIAIGTTTAKALADLGIKDCVVSNTLSEISLVDVCY
jgi:hydroxymethylbilane synthase